MGAPRKGPEAGSGDEIARLLAVLVRISIGTDLAPVLMEESGISPERTAELLGSSDDSEGV